MYKLEVDHIFSGFSSGHRSEHNCGNGSDCSSGLLYENEDTCTAQSSDRGVPSHAEKFLKAATKLEHDEFMIVTFQPLVFL